MSDTSKREELIEEAATMLRHYGYGHLADGIEAMFEQAHTPTDDERAIINDDTAEAWQAIADALGDLGYALDSAEQTAEWVQQYLFRRTVQGEPTATCPKCGTTVTDQTPSTFYTSHDETCGGALEEPQGERAQARSERLLAVAEELGLARPEADFDIATGRPLAPEWWTVHHPEPQGEPTGATIVDMLTAFYGEERDGWSMGKVRRMRAALTAAYETKGEGR